MAIGSDLRQRVTHTDVSESEPDRSGTVAPQATGVQQERTPPAPHSDLQVSAADAFHQREYSRPRVSVIIPFTRAAKAKNAIHAVAGQGYPEQLLEIVLVGEGSSQVADEWPETVCVDTGPIFRPGRARNIGASHASGDILIFLDDDCVPDSGWIEANLQELDDSRVGALGGKVASGSRNAYAQAVDLANFGMCQIDERQERPICTATFAIRREVFEEIGPFDESLKVHEDIDYCHRLNRAGYSTVFEPSVRVRHDHGRESLGSLVGYLFYGGATGGLEIERRYRDDEAFYKTLLLFDNPLMYSIMAIPFAVLATARTMLHNLAGNSHALVLTPLVFLGKLSCHLGILSWIIKNSRLNSPVVRESWRLVEYTLFKTRFKKPRVLTLFVTSQCNAKCGHCFYWMNLNQNNDMSFAEIVELSNSLDKVDVLLVSGGEPFLRKDLPEICELFFERNDLGQVNIPTNGLQPKKTYEMLRQILQVARGGLVHVSLSIDGTEAIHDEIRAVPGNFRKAVETFETIAPLQAEYPNLRLRVNTTVLNKNYSDLYEFFEEHESNFPGANTPSFSLLRGTPYDKSMLLPEERDLRHLYEYRNTHSPGVRSFLSKFIDRLIFELSMETLAQDTQVVPCEAGRIQGVVEDNGNVRHCELLPPIGNLREADFNEIWNSPHAQAERQKIANRECRCTHECYLYPSLLGHPTAALKVLGPTLKRRG